MFNTFLIVSILSNEALLKTFGNNYIKTSLTKEEELGNLIVYLMILWFSTFSLFYFVFFSYKGIFGFLKLLNKLVSTF